jgi:nitroimidazol reductase NimA-like FMN-containing flavoprotein (pyridoxamine 5'-phosphate oxidase superfamily)
MQRRGATALDEEQIDALMTESWIIRLATHGPGDRINVTPLWFCWAGGKIYAFSRGQKVENLRRNPSCTVIADRNERYPELQGAMFQGTGRILEDAAEEAADDHLDSVVRDRMGRKYQEGGFGDPTNTRNESSAMGANWRWIVVTPDRCISWDNAKLRRSKRKK